MYSENMILASLLRKEIKELGNRKEEIENTMNEIYQDDDNVKVFVGLLESPGVKEWIHNKMQLDKIESTITAKRNSFRHNLQETCEHPAMLYKTTSGENWICTCLVCKNTIFRRPQDIDGKVIVTPTLYNHNISIDDLNEEYLTLYEDISEEATDVMVKKYNRIDRKR